MVRSVAMDGMVALVTSGQRTRDEVMAYFLTSWSANRVRSGMAWLMFVPTSDRKRRSRNSAEPTQTA
jgi:hypothetical protein